MAGHLLLVLFFILGILGALLLVISEEYAKLKKWEKKHHLYKVALGVGIALVGLAVICLILYLISAFGKYRHAQGVKNALTA